MFNTLQGEYFLLKFLLLRENDDVFAPEILDPYCKFCYAKKFKTSALKIAEIVEIAPDLGFVL